MEKWSTFISIPTCEINIKSITCRCCLLRWLCLVFFPLLIDSLVVGSSLQRFMIRKCYNKPSHNAQFSSALYEYMRSKILKFMEKILPTAGIHTHTHTHTQVHAGGYSLNLRERQQHQLPKHRFFLVSLCLKANAEMVPKIPSCHYMLLM